MKILLLNGPNISFLGRREPHIYGNATLDDLVKDLTVKARDKGVELDAFQSNIEGELVNAILSAYGKYDGIILNPAAFTHTSVALRDAIQAVAIPCVEVHITNTLAREDFRHTSLTAAACIGQIMGFGLFSYTLALEAIVFFIKTKQKRS